MIISAERGRVSATTRSGPAPRVTNERARRLARAFSSANVQRTSPQTTAVAPGVRAAWASNSSGTVTSGRSAGPRFHDVRIVRSSSGPSRSTRPTGRAGAGAIPVRAPGMGAAGALGGGAGGRGGEGPSRRGGVAGVGRVPRGGPRSSPGVARPGRGVVGGAGAPRLDRREHTRLGRVLLGGGVVLED